MENWIREKKRDSEREIQKQNKNNSVNEKRRHIHRAFAIALCAHTGTLVFTIRKKIKKRKRKKIIAHTNDIGKLGDENGEVLRESWKKTQSEEVEEKNCKYIERQRRRWQQQQYRKYKQTTKAKEQ